MLLQISFYSLRFPFQYITIQHILYEENKSCIYIDLTPTNIKLGNPKLVHCSILRFIWFNVVLQNTVFVSKYWTFKNKCWKFIFFNIFIFVFDHILFTNICPTLLQNNHLAWLLFKIIAVYDPEINFAFGMLV